MDGEKLFAFVESESEPAVLATIISARGHSYRKEGASMIVTESGRKFSSISPGCLEADLKERVSRLWAEGSYEIVDYNMQPEEDPLWGEEIGCGGVIRVLLEPLAGVLPGMLMEIGRRVRGGEPVWLVRCVSGGRLCYLLEGAHDRFGKMGGAAAGEVLYESCFAPRERLVIFGAGEEAVELEELARKIGFRTAVADWRAALCHSDRLPYAETVVGNADEIVRSLGIGRDDYVLVGSHHLRRDRDMITRVMPLHPAYLGIIGSAKRVQLLMGGETLPAFVKAPVGLAIGAEGAEEIAVSVAAELIAWRKAIRTGAAERRRA